MWIPGANVATSSSAWRICTLNEKILTHGRLRDTYCLIGLWICVALTYLLGDVLRIFTGDFTPGEIGGVKVTQAMSMGIAVLMVIPIVMVFLSLVLGYSVNRWANVIIAIFFFGFNFLGIPTYASLFEKFLLGVSLVFNALTIWLAWHWTV
jgi:hypothetical protein